VSRFTDYDDYEGEPEQILAQGRWQRNAEQVLRSKRGRRALAEIREALTALPEHRLIDGAVCTVGDVDTRFPAITEAELEQARAGGRKAVAEYGLDPGHPEDCARWLREGREEQRRAYMSLVQDKGAGVCLIGAYAWHKKVREGMDPAAAFAAIPVLGDTDPDAGDQLNETAEVGQDAGLAYTLAWELAYRNDETYASKTPEERWEAFVAWIDQQLATAVA
jgi:hypothetical protein